MSQTQKSRTPRHWSPVHPAAAAIDIGATMHVAAVGPDRDEQPVRTFRTFTDDLKRLADWFTRCGIKTIAMESTGVYWIPVFEILEQRGFEVMVVNARDAKHVPGRKTDVSDAQWLQRLHEYGLLRASFRPQAEIAGLRAYLRRRERLLDLRSVAHPAHAKGTDADEPAIAAWPTAKHFTSWLALAPHNKISGGRVLSSRTRRTSNRAASLLRLAAGTVGRTDTALGAFYRRLSARIGKAKAITATARKIAVLFYNTLRLGMAYTDPGATYYEDRYRQRVLHNLQRRAKS